MSSRFCFSSLVVQTYLARFSQVSNQKPTSASHFQLACICCVVWKYPLIKSQYSVVAKLGPPKSSMVFSLLTPIAVSLLVVDVCRRWTSGLGPAALLHVPSCRWRRLSCRQMFTRGFLNIFQRQVARSKPPAPVFQSGACVCVWREAAVNNGSLFVHPLVNTVDFGFVSASLPTTAERQAICNIAALNTEVCTWHSKWSDSSKSGLVEMQQVHKK